MRRGRRACAPPPCPFLNVGTTYDGTKLAWRARFACNRSFRRRRVPVPIHCVPDIRKDFARTCRLSSANAESITSTRAYYDNANYLGEGATAAFALLPPPGIGATTTIATRTATTTEPLPTPTSPISPTPPVARCGSRKYFGQCGPCLPCPGKPIPRPGLPKVLPNSLRRSPLPATVTTTAIARGSTEHVHSTYCAYAGSHSYDGVCSYP